MRQSEYGGYLQRQKLIANLLICQPEGRTSYSALQASKPGIYLNARYPRLQAKRAAD